MEHDHIVGPKFMLVLFKVLEKKNRYKPHISNFKLSVKNLVGPLRFSFNQILLEGWTTQYKKLLPTSQIWGYKSRAVNSKHTGKGNDKFSLLQCKFLVIRLLCWQICNVYYTQTVAQWLACRRHSINTK